MTMQRSDTTATGGEIGGASASCSVARAPRPPRRLGLG